MWVHSERGWWTDVADLKTLDTDTSRGYELCMLYFCFTYGMVDLAGIVFHFGCNQITNGSMPVPTVRETS